MERNDFLTVTQFEMQIRETGEKYQDFSGYFIVRGETIPCQSWNKTFSSTNLCI